MKGESEIYKSPFVSVVMCTFNTEKYIAEAIESVLTQTFTDFEFIIWDDGSTDRTKEIVESFKDERIRYFYHENTGLGMALKLACAEAKGKYIARMDSDDICFSNRLEEELRYIENHPDVVLVSSAVKYIDDEGKTLGRSFPYTNDEIIKRVLYNGESVIVHPASLFRRDVYEKTGGYYPLKKAQDLLLFSRLSKIGKIANIPFQLIHYRLTLNSISTETMGSSYQDELKRIMKKMIKEDIICEEDILRYNEIFDLIKRENASNPNLQVYNMSRYHKSVEEKLYSILRPLMSTSRATNFIVNLKNLIGKYKYQSVC